MAEGAEAGHGAGGYHAVPDGDEAADQGDEGELRRFPPEIPVMQPAHPRQPDDLRARRRSVLDGSAHRRVLPEPAMRPVLVMVRDVLAEQASEMPFVEDDHMVEQLCPDASDPAFRGSVLPRRPVRRAD